MCKKIHRGGNQAIPANKKYKRVESLGRRRPFVGGAIFARKLAKEPRAQMLACRGTAGLRHLSCLAEQAKILFAGQENNLDDKVKNERFIGGPRSAQQAGLPRCKVWCALGVWKRTSMAGDGSGSRNSDERAWARFRRTGYHEDALSVKEAELATNRRLGGREEIMTRRGRTIFAMTYDKLDGTRDALAGREVYNRRRALEPENPPHFRAASLANSLKTTVRRGEGDSKRDAADCATRMATHTIPLGLRFIPKFGSC